MELRRLRDQAGVTIETVADRLGCSSSKISRIETGHIGVSPRDATEMLAIYEVDPALAAELIQTAKDARQKGWWQAYGTALTGAYVGFEQATSRIRGYEAQLIPGLLQTPDYATAVFTAARPNITIELLRSRLEVRSKRQSLLSLDDPVDFQVILDEAALRRVVGNAEIMSAQLGHMLEVAQEPNITVQVIPFSRGAHAGMEGTFVILEYSEGVYQDLVFVENAVGGLFLEKDVDLDRYRTLFGILQETALNAERSLELISERAKELQ
ncbi:MAG TPA: helix-turn-helix transcriptional regulator [Micromonosporaceae bacterium]|jgi:transcriptional regulator with XRE-family HTH domain